MSNEDMIAVLQCYIHHRTDKEITIAKPKTPQQHLLLVKAYESCIKYFKKN